MLQPPAQWGWIDNLNTVGAQTQMVEGDEPGQLWWGTQRSADLNAAGDVAKDGLMGIAGEPRYDRPEVEATHAQAHLRRQSPMQRHGAIEVEALQARTAEGDPTIVQAQGKRAGADGQITQPHAV